ncbi:MAG: UDP-N-acetylglucosamine 1-carboxyvinyltransferase, partial [Oscillospiraceae bacterium]|nr:UDP-N-acetylglucosamine 1-carboxyvinyltransferase [Oscillospiraceae bacterium]
LARFLRACGAQIAGEGTGTIVIRGVKQLHGCTYRIMPDRIVAATWLAAAAAAGGELSLRCVSASDLESILAVFEEMNCRMSASADSICFHAAAPLRAVRTLKTMPYPGFPTDAQAILMAALCCAAGTTVIEETIFENRFRHVDALVKMGADIRTAGRVAVINGVRSLHGAAVEATDLRGGAAMLIAGLCAAGETIITEIHHIDRGYDSPEQVLRSVGAEIIRV